MSAVDHLEQDRHVTAGLVATPRFQDAVCALRLAVWTLERAPGKDEIDPLPVIEMIARRAEELRRAVILERAVV
ncbi:MAG TPA: hypothetical protein VF230_12580 [Acidimicrobiales bacterium]